MKYKVGDRLQITNFTSKHDGRAVTVEIVFSEEKQIPYYVRDDLDNCYRLYDCELEVICSR